MLVVVSEVGSIYFPDMQIRLLSMLEEYSILRQEKEQEQRRQRVWPWDLGRSWVGFVSGSG